MFLAFLWMHDFFNMIAGAPVEHRHLLAALVEAEYMRTHPAAARHTRPVTSPWTNDAGLCFAVYDSTDCAVKL